MRHLLTTTVLLVAFVLKSASVDLFQAETVAQNFVSAEKMSTLQKLKSPLLLQDNSTGQTLAYAYNLSDKGFVIVSADDLLPPVISFNNEGLFAMDSPLAKMLTADLKLRLKQQAKQSVAAKAKIMADWHLYADKSFTKESPRYQQWPPAGTTTTGGWTVTKWHQEAPYNQYCPIKLSSGQRSYTGCPSTAMAQILNYHHQINSTRFIQSDRYYHNYTQSFWIDDAWQTYKFISFDSLNTFLDSIQAKYSAGKDLNTNEKAALTLAAGFACKTVYDPAGSGTFSVSQAFVAFQRFGYSNAILLDSSATDEAIKQKMIQNIQNAQPVHLATVDVNWQSGHNVVCDGYRDNGFFRLNMGWGGASDNWYSLPEGFPYSLTVFEGIVADIQSTASIQPMQTPKDNQLKLQSYPNPFNNNTSISLTSVSETNVQLALYNIRGEKVCQIYSGMVNKGINQYNFDATRLSGGLYFLKADGDGICIAEKLMLLK